MGTRFNHTLLGVSLLYPFDFACRGARRFALHLVLGASLALGACQPFSAAEGGSQSGAAGSAGQPPAGGSGGSSSAGASVVGGAGGGIVPGAGAGGTAATGGDSSGGGGGAAAGGPLMGSAGAPSSCPCSAPTPTCEAGRCVVRGPQMVHTNSFYIDSTEVTSAQYAVFLAAKGAKLGEQPAECSWNTSYGPEFVQGQPVVRPKQPVTNVDWCDAAAYCAWADKQLCGKIGGGELGLAELADPSKSQWYLACAGPQSQAYPYGPTLQNGACNDGTNTDPQLSEVAQFEKCQGYYPGLFDMLGNAQEWTASCVEHTGAHDTCERIGGSYESTKVCSDSGAAERGVSSPKVGFRCCSR